jgi:hypothetical protein
MRRVIGGFLVIVGLGLATVTIGSSFGYLTILSSGEDEPVASLRDMTGTLVFEFALVGTGLLLAIRRRVPRTAPSNPQDGR